MLETHETGTQKKRSLHPQKIGSSTGRYVIRSQARVRFEKTDLGGYRQIRSDKILKSALPTENSYSTLYRTAPQARAFGKTPASGSAGLQPTDRRSRSLLRFTPGEIAAEEAFYQKTKGDSFKSSAAGTSYKFKASGTPGFKDSMRSGVTQEGQRFKHLKTPLSRLDHTAGIKESLENEASNELSKEAEQSENAALITADKGRVTGATNARISFDAGKRYRGTRSIREDKRISKKAAKERITLEKEKLYEMRTGREAPSAVRRQRRQLKRRQIRKFANQTIGVKKTDVLVRFAKVLQKLTVKVGAAVVSWIGVPLAIFLALAMVLFGFCSMLFSAVTNTAVVAMSSYTSEEAAIEAASMLATQLESKLEKELAGIPSAWEWGHIDEFRYFTEEIGHDPFELMAYLSVKYPGFDMGITSPVQLVISDLHKRRYKLELDEVVETRTDTEITTDPVTGEQVEEEFEYDYYILNIYLTSRSIESAARPELQDSEGGELWEWYRVLMDTGGARQEIANPFPNTDWRSAVTSLYGYRLDPIHHTNLQIHRGLDIAMPLDTSIYAGLTGTVSYVGYDATFGNYIILEDDKGTVVKYAHCQSIPVNRGETVTARETIIATVGNTGASTGSHLHIEMKRNGKYLNPIYAIVYEQEGQNETNS